MGAHLRAGEEYRAELSHTHGLSLFLFLSLSSSLSLFLYIYIYICLKGLKESNNRCIEYYSLFSDVTIQ